MDIIIAGIGKVGGTLARQLVAEGHNLTLVDPDKRLLERMVEQYDVMAVEGNCASMRVLQDAGIAEAELVIAVTGEDEVNLLCCLTAHGLNPKVHTIARIRDPEYAEQVYGMRELYNLSMTVNPERQAAREIDRLLKLPGFLRRESFAKGLAEIVELRIDNRSKLKDLNLIEMYKAVRCRVLVCTVLRNGEAIIPSGQFVLREGDRIFVTAPTANLAVLLKNLGLTTRKVRNCLIGGGGRISYYLAQQLQKDGVTVRIIERDEKRCRELATALPDCTIVCGDCCDREELEQQGLGVCDAYLSMTGMDEMNMIASLYAGSREVPQVITKLGRSGSVNLADSMNLGSVICPRELCSGDIVRYVRAMENQTGAAVSVHPIAEGKAEAVEFVVEKNTEHCGIPLKQLKLKSGVLLAVITRGTKVEIPGGDSVIKPGDIVVAVTTGHGALQSLNDIFA